MSSHFNGAYGMSDALGQQTPIVTTPAPQAPEPQPQAPAGGEQQNGGEQK